MSTLTIDYSSYATTTPAGSVGGSITLRNSSTLTLGSATTLSGNLDVESYATLDMANNPLSAATVYLGWNSGQPITILNRARSLPPALMSPTRHSTSTRPTT